MNKIKSSGVNAGSISLIVVFSVVCLAVFASLSLSTSAAEKDMAEKSAAVVSDYYAADLKCAETASDFVKMVKEGASAADITNYASLIDAGIYEDEDYLEISFTEQINEKQELYAVLSITNDNLSVKEWRVRSVGDWLPDDTLLIWDGE